MMSNKLVEKMVIRFKDLKESGFKKIITICYGDGNKNVDEAVMPDYLYDKNNPKSTENKVEIRMPKIEGTIIFEKDVLVDEIDEKNATATLTFIEGAVDPIKNALKIKFDIANTYRSFKFSVGEFDASDESGKLGASWGEQVDASIFALGAILSLSVEFTVSIQDENLKLRSITFNVLSNVSAKTHYESQGSSMVSMPLIQIFSEQYQQDVNPGLTLINPKPKNGDLVQINYGKPAVPGAPDYSYDNPPDEYNIVSLTAPFEFSLELDNTKYPNGIFKRIKNYSVKMRIPGAVDFIYNRSKEDIQKMFTQNGRTITFNMPPDWKNWVLASTLNKAGECSIIYDFEMEIETTAGNKTITVNNSAMPLKGIKFNSQQK